MHKKSPHVFVPIPRPGGGVAYIAAGSARCVPEGYRLIRLAADIAVPGDVEVAYDVAVSDFESFDAAHIMAVAPDVLDDLDSGERLFAGCGAGIGRTGTFLACLVAHHPAFQAPRGAVEYVRQVYHPGAVETGDQARLVEAVARRAAFGPSSAAMPETPRRRTILDRLRGLVRG